MSWTTILAAIGDLGTFVASIGSLVGIWMVYKTVRTDHDWRRREYAMDLIGGWNEKTQRHTDVIIKHFPGLRESGPGSEVSGEITRLRATEIYDSSPDREENWELRLNIVYLLNHLEYVAAAYSHGVADRQIVEDHLRQAVVYWYEALLRFVEVNKDRMRRDSWEPLTTVVDDWNRRPPIQPRRPTG